MVERYFVLRQALGLLLQGYVRAIRAHGLSLVLVLILEEMARIPKRAADQ